MALSLRISDPRPGLSPDQALAIFLGSKLRLGLAAEKAKMTPDDFLMLLPRDDAAREQINDMMRMLGSIRAYEMTNNMIDVIENAAEEGKLADVVKALQAATGLLVGMLGKSEQAVSGPGGTTVNVNHYDGLMKIAPPDMREALMLLQGGGVQPDMDE